VEKNICSRQKGIVTTQPTNEKPKIKIF